MTDFLTYPYIVLGIDPGPHTGIARIDGQILGYAGTAWLDGDVPYLPVARELERALNIAYIHSAPLYVVVERFSTIQPGIGNTRAAMDTLKMIGAIEYWYQLWRTNDYAKYGLHIVWQTPNMRKSAEPAARQLVKLRGVGTVHEVSALAHALVARKRHLGAEADAASLQ